MTNAPSRTLRELVDLLVAYARQETLDPLRRLKRLVGFGLLGAILVATGFVLVSLGLLRMLQTETDAFDGNWSFAPYLLVAGISAIALAIAFRSMGRR